MSLDASREKNTTSTIPRPQYLALPHRTSPTPLTPCCVPLPHPPTSINDGNRPFLRLHRPFLRPIVLAMVVLLFVAAQTLCFTCNGSRTSDGQAGLASGEIVTMACGRRVVLVVEPDLFPP